MAKVVCESHFWTLKHPMVNNSHDISCYSYHDKKEQDGIHSVHEEKQHYAESRDVMWYVRNKRPERLRDSLKEVEDVMINKQCVNFKWLSRRHLQVWLSNAIIVSYVVNPCTGDIDRIYIDKSLVGKLSADPVSDILLTTDYLIACFPDRPKVDFVQFSKKRPSSNDCKFEKLSSFDPKVTTLDVPGPVGRKLNRRMVYNARHSLVLCWWSFGLNDISPWVPMTGDKELANLVLLEVNGPKLEVISYTRTPGDLASVKFSQIRPDLILTVEQTSTSQHSSFDFIVTAYSITGNKLHRVSATTIPVKAEICCVDYTPDEQRVLVGCFDRSIHIFDVQRKITLATKIDLVPSIIKFHPSGVLCALLSATGEFQLFDMALSPMELQPVSDNLHTINSLSLASHLKLSTSLQLVEWIPCNDKLESQLSTSDDLLAFIFDKGPVGVFVVHHGISVQSGLSPLYLINQYLRMRHIDKAVHILRVLDWNTDGKLSYTSLSAIVNYLLKLPLNDIHERQLYETLGCFYNSSIPLSEVSVLEFRDSMNQLARKFFHHLLRYGRFEKAYLLAIDIGSRDLFMDIHFAARERGEKTLSEVAMKKARELKGDSNFPDSSLRRDASDAESIESVGHVTDDDDDFTDQPNPVFEISQESFDYRNTEQCSRTLKRDVAELVQSRLEADLASQFNDDFTETFMKPWSAVDVVDNQENSDGQRSSTVHVVHFGLV